MSDYSFMKSGFSNFDDENNNVRNKFLEYSQLLLTLFIAKSTKIGARYCALGNRNTLTREDIKYAMKYQAIEFFKLDIPTELEDIKRELEEIMAQESSEDENIDGDEYDYGNYLEEGEREEGEEMDDEEMDDEEDEEPFSRVDYTSLSNKDDILFVRMMHHYQNYWEEWVPNSYFEKKIKEAIEQVNDQ